MDNRDLLRGWMRPTETVWREWDTTEEDEKSLKGRERR
jgi:hypothetical protein